MNKDFCYCNGNGCAIKEHCVRYREGLQARKQKGEFLWMDECGEERDVYIPA